MNPDNLLDACESFEMFLLELQQAHMDAVGSENPFAQVAIYSLLEKAEQLEDRLTRLKTAAITANAKKGKST